jgi:hypothetical protein
MRNMNCENIRREIEEAGSADFLSAAVVAHLKGCGPCEKVSREQSNLQKIISSLGRVEAPGNFDFRLRARLAREKGRQTRFFQLSSFSFGLRSAAVTAMLLLLGSALLIVSLRTRPDNPVVAGGNQIAPPPADSGSKTPPQLAVAPKAIDSGAIKANLRPAGPAPKRSESRMELASLRGGKRFGTRDLSSTPAAVLKRYPQLAETYPTAAFPINASNQSLKVSMDDGSGVSRTISLPTVSFGSQRALSQSTSPLMASARGSW